MSLDITPTPSPRAHTSRPSLSSSGIFSRDTYVMGFNDFVDLELHEQIEQLREERHTYDELRSFLQKAEIVFRSAHTQACNDKIWLDLVYLVRQHQLKVLKQAE